MSETPQPLDDGEEEILPETEEKKEPFATTTDIVVAIALALAGLGFWFWYDGARKASTDHFHVADSLYSSGNYPAALEAYSALRNSESVIAKSDDSLMYLRMDSLEAFQDADLRMAEAARAALISGDSSLILAARDALGTRTHGFVPATLLDSLKP